MPNLTTRFLLGAAGSEQPLSANEGDVQPSIEDLVREVRLAGGNLVRHKIKKIRHWAFSWKDLPGRRQYVYDGGMSRDDLYALYLADTEMNFYEPNDQGAQTLYVVRFAAGSWKEHLAFRNGDMWRWDVQVEIVQAI